MNKILFPLAALFLSGAVCRSEPKAAVESSAPVCATITDGFCAQLWDAEHQGNLKTADGEIILGRSNKSNLIDLVTIEEKKALIHSVPRWPEDLRMRAKNLLARLKMNLKDEAETITWIRRYNRWDQDWNQILSDVAEERAIRRHPEMKKIRLSDRTQIESSFINREYYQLLDELTIAKYSQHPDWKRVENSFEMIRGHLLTEIGEFPYSEEFKSFLRKRVSEVELTLPLLNTDVFDGRRDCAEGAINAYYLGNYNKITICTGLIHSLKSDSSIFLILAHELSHSIDPSMFNMAWLQENGERTKALRPLIGIKDKPLACDQWQNILATFAQAPIEKVASPRPYDSLALCLDGGKPLQKNLTESEVRRQVDEDLVDSFNYLSNRNIFSTMVVPSFTEFGKEKQNPFYLGPDVFMASFSDKGYATTNMKIRSVPLSFEIFYQVVQCEYEKLKTSIPLNVFFTEKGPPEKTKILKSSIEVTKQIYGGLFEESYSSCGQFCGAFVRKNMARNVDEKFADWMAFRIFKRYLLNKKSLEERRFASAMALANLCDRPSVRQAAGVLLEVEKTYSIEPHGENRERRLSLYNEAIAEVVQCKPETTQAWGSCPLNDKQGPQ